MEHILVEGAWRPAHLTGSFYAQNPGTREALPGEFPVSSWADCDRALQGATEAARVLRDASGEQIGAFLTTYADGIESRADDLVETAHRETALAVKPRLRDVELPRTTTQLRQAAAGSREGSWRQAVLDTKNNIRSCFAPVGPVVVFGPNNFPFAFNGISGGDFAAAVATGCPVLAKAHPLHPATSRTLAECAVAALESSGLPSTTVQMLYHLSNEDGLRLVADARVGATSFTGSRTAGMALKSAAERAGRLIYLEMSSLNPIVFLPGALAERLDVLITETADSGLAAAGQFCTSPNLLFLVESREAKRFVDGLTKAYAVRARAPLLSETGLQRLDDGVQRLRDGGAHLLTGGAAGGAARRGGVPKTLPEVSAKQFLLHGDALQEEAFGNAATVVLCANADELHAAVASLDGNLTGSIYSDTAGADDELYASVGALLRSRVGRLLNDKMPTGVALSPAMNHGGPFPSTAHPGFTAVGIPRSMQRFGALECYDGVRSHRLPPALQDKAPHDAMWRQIDGAWVRG